MTQGRHNMQLFVCTIVRERNIDLFHFFSAWIYVIFRQSEQLQILIQMYTYIGTNLCTFICMLYRYVSRWIFILSGGRNIPGALQNGHTREWVKRILFYNIWISSYYRICRQTLCRNYAHIYVCSNHVHTHMYRCAHVLVSVFGFCVYVMYVKLLNVCSISSNNQIIYVYGCV